MHSSTDPDPMKCYNSICNNGETDQMDTSNGEGIDEHRSTVSCLMHSWLVVG